jgi:hypothetical protein
VFPVRCKIDTGFFVVSAGLTGQEFPNIGCTALKEGHEMIIRKMLLGLAASGLVLGSTAATAAPAALDRSGSEFAASEDLAGVGTFGLLLALLIVAGVVAIVASDDDEDLPTSP